jgi:hypothetical protein
MSEWPKEQLVSELVALERLGDSRLDVTRPQPLDSLLDVAPTLARVIPAVLMHNPTKPSARVAAAKQLLERVAFSSDIADVKSAGDLLGFTDLSEDEMVAVFKTHKELIPSERLKKFSRYLRKPRVILAVRYNPRSVQWFGQHPEIEQQWITAFVDELCTYLDDEDGKLTQFAKDLGYLPTAEVDPADDPLLLSPMRLVMDEEKSKQIVREVLEEPDEIGIYRLALSLNFDPPLVCAACDYLKDEGISVDSACRILAKDTGIFLDSLARHIEQPPITRRLRQEIETLEAEHPRAIRALDFIAFLHYEHISVEYVLAYLLERQYIDLETFEHASLIFDGAVQPLIDAGLLEQDGAFIRMNPLVHSVVRELRRDKCSEINDRLVSYGFTDLNATPSAWQLMEAKWSPTSIAARWMLDYILSARLVDQLQNHGRLARAGKCAGADWILIVEALRARCVDKAGSSWFLFEAARHFETKMPLLRDGSLVAWRDAKFERQEFYDQIEWLEIGPTIERVSDKLEAIIEGLSAKQEGVDILDLVRPHFKKQFGEFYTEVDTAFHLDDVATPVGNLRFSDYFPQWKRSQQPAIEPDDAPIAPGANDSPSGIKAPEIDADGK